MLTRPAGWCSRSRTPNAVARYGASRSIVFGEDIDPDAAITALDNVTFDEVRQVAAGVADNLAVACVGPHSAEEF